MAQLVVHAQTVAKAEKKQQKSTIHSYDVLGGAIQVTSGAVLTYDLHFKN